MYGPEHDKYIKRWLKVRLLHDEIKKCKLQIEDLQKNGMTSDDDQEEVVRLQNRIERMQSYLQYIR